MASLKLLEEAHPLWSSVNFHFLLLRKEATPIASLGFNVMNALHRAKGDIVLIDIYSHGFTIQL